MDIFESSFNESDDIIDLTTRGEVEFNSGDDIVSHLGLLANLKKDKNDFKKKAFLMEIQ